MSDDLGAWIARELTRLQIRITGAEERFHERIWSIVDRVPTDAGTLYAKAPGPAGIHEAALLQLLQSTHPHCIPELLAADVTRGWMLMRDGGGMLRALLQADNETTRWMSILPAYAQLQIDLVARVDELLVIGVPDRRLRHLPSMYAELIEQADLPAPRREELRALQSNVSDACERLAAFGIPETLHHGDLHDGNIFVRAEPAERFGFYDWGDSGIAHPFFSLRATLASIERTLNLPEGSPQAAAMSDAYLSQWRQFASPVALREAFKESQPLAAIEGALVWHRTLSPIEPRLTERYVKYVAILLEDFAAAARNAV